MNSQFMKFIAYCFGFFALGFITMVTYNKLEIEDLIYYMPTLYLFSLFMGFIIKITTLPVAFIICLISVNIAAVGWFIMENRDILSFPQNDQLLILIVFISGNALAIFMGACLKKN